SPGDRGRLAGLVLEERQPPHQLPYPPPRRLDALLQVLVLLLEVGDAATYLGIEPRRRCAARLPVRLLEVGLGLEGARVPGGELVRHIAQHRLQLVQGPRISSFSVVRQTRPPSS